MTGRLPKPWQIFTASIVLALTILFVTVIKPAYDTQQVRHLIEAKQHNLIDDENVLPDGLVSQIEKYCPEAVRDWLPRRILDVFL